MILSNLKDPLLHVIYVTSFKIHFKLQRKTIQVYTASGTFVAIKLPLIVIKGKCQQRIDE